jgi:hypothetical protein
LSFDEAVVQKQENMKTLFLASPRPGVTILALIAALIGAPTRALTAPTDSERGESPAADVATARAGAISASLQRWVALEARRDSRTNQTSQAPAANPCKVSVAEKAAFVLLLVGGSIMAVYGPQEKEGGNLTNDGRSELIGGAGAVVVSFMLLHEMLSKRAAAAAHP